MFCFVLGKNNESFSLKQSVQLDMPNPNCCFFLHQKQVVVSELSNANVSDNDVNALYDECCECDAIGS